MKCFVSFLSLLILLSFPVFAFADTSTNNRIHNTGEMDDITENFVDVYQSSSSAAYGGAVYNDGASSVIQTITGNFINNYVTSSSYAYGGAIYNSGTINKITGSNSGFNGNYAVSSSSDAYGGAIYNSGSISEISGNFNENYVSGSFAYGGAIYNYISASLSKITGDFTNNYATGFSAYGGAIFNLYGVTIDSISGDFAGNSATSSQDGTGGGAIYNNGTINEISGNFNNNYVSGYSGYGGAILQIAGVMGSIEGNFSNNYAKTTSMYALGGAIFSYYSSIKSITGDFNNNYAASDTMDALGGAVSNASGTINTITGTFTGNYVSSGTSAKGGAIYNTGIISSIIGSFIDNYALGSTALGGAIYTTASLLISANGEGTIDLFSGNYISSDDGITKTYQAIYVDNKDATLTLEATDNGVIEFNDIIDGATGYNVLITGNSTGDDTNDSTSSSPGVVKLYNDINNANVTTENVIIDLIDEKIHNYTFDSLTSQDSSLWEIDVNLLDKSADTITLTNTSSGTIVINNINFLDLTSSDESVIVRILYNADNVELALGDNIHFINDIYSDLPDEVHSSELYSKIEGINIATTETTNDSLEIYPDKVYDTLAIINQKESKERSFIFDEDSSIYTATEDIGETTSGTLNIEGIEGSNSTIDFNSHSGFIVNDDTTLNISDVIITGASGETGSVLNVGEGGTVNIIDSIITSNYTDGDAVINNEGTINIEADNSNVEFTNNSSSAIYNTGEINMNASGADIILNDTITGKITQDDDGNSEPEGTINILGSSDSTSGSVYIENEISSNTINMKSGSIYFTTSTDEDGNTTTGTFADDVNFNYTSGEVSLVDDSINSANLGNITLYGDMSLSLDANLASKVMDTITASGFESNGYSINISNINITEPTTETTITISPLGDIEDEVLKSTIAAAIKYTGGDIIYSPIYKYSVSYAPDTALLTFGLIGSSGNYSSYNPSIFAAPIAAQIGGYLTQLNSYDEAFRNMDMYMLLTSKQRQALKFRNKYAYIGPDTFKVYQSANNMMENNALWTRPYSTFENVKLHGGQKVSNVAYGSFVGGESKMYDLGHGWDGVFGTYIGYNGSQQSYQSIDIYQDGGTLGVVGMAYKDNFYSGLTVNVGANAAEAGTMYGNDNFAMLMAGAAWKSGYNFELAEDKFVIQPNYLMSYTFVDTFDFTDAAGVRIKSNPLNAIQIEPGVKFIANLRNGWQSYLGVSMVWNIIDSTKFKANDVSLPELSIKPFVKYGVGLRRIWGERFAGYFQSYITNGGRNGVGLQFGLRWTF
ncbi:MAG: hypothetical protein LUH11_02630 [Candidatus Gastranaerophilales bacterium]|nr:hypothetical protein [Candidatus Gastranaerophilales bacterium]